MNLEEIEKLLKSIGYFPLLYIFVVGAPSILLIAETVFLQYRLVDSLHWIVEGWERLNLLMARLLIPLTEPLVSFINSFGFQFELSSHWQSVFWLSMLPVISVTRAMLTDSEELREHLPPLMVYVVFGVPLAFCAFFSGLVPPENDWRAQGLIVVVPIVVGVIVISVVIHLTNRRESTNENDSNINVRKFLYRATIFCFLVLITAIALSNIPGVYQSSLLTYTAIILFLGIYCLYEHLSRQGPRKNRVALYTGLFLVGGFVTAGTIVLADIVVKNV